MERISSLKVNARLFVSKMDNLNYQNLKRFGIKIDLF